MLLSDFLKSEENIKIGGRVISFYCPACKEEHSIYIEGDNTKGPQWIFNGNVDKPTFTPSVRVSGMMPSDIPEDFNDPTKDKPFICHFHIVNGNIVYCEDCSHESSGKTIPMIKIN